MTTSETRRKLGVATTARLIHLLVLSAALASGALAASDDPADSEPSGPADIAVSFKLDPRITKATYMGDRWVSPPTYIRTGQGSELTIDAKLELRDAHGRPTPSATSWYTSNPEMVSVTQPADSRDVAITIHRPGTCTLEVSSGTVSKELVIAASSRGDSGLYVEITQGPVATRELP